MIATFRLPPPYGATRFMLRHEFLEVGKGKVTQAISQFETNFCENYGETGFQALGIVPCVTHLCSITLCSEGLACSEICSTVLTYAFHQLYFLPSNK